MVYIYIYIYLDDFMACGAADISFLSSSVNWVAHFPMYKTEIHGFPISDSKGMN